jgi:hypothetical protein
MLLSLAAGCAGPGQAGTERTAFTDPALGGKLFYRVHTDEPVDLIVWFRNSTSQPAHLLRISVAAQTSKLRLIGTSIYNVDRIGYNPATAVGILPEECPSHFSPHLVSTLTVAAHAQSPWLGVIALRVTTAGRYLITRIKYTYAVGKNRYWQYYNDPVLLIVSNPAMPGPLPLPASAVCR